MHALISTETVPVMRVGFLPVIPSPVTDYATVRKALTHFQSVRSQLDQVTLPVFCDEGVFHTVADIVYVRVRRFLRHISNDGNVPYGQGVAALRWQISYW